MSWYETGVKAPSINMPDQAPGAVLGFGLGNIFAKEIERQRTNEATALAQENLELERAMKQAAMDRAAEESALNRAIKQQELDANREFRNNQLKIQQGELDLGKERNRLQRIYYDMLADKAITDTQIELRKLDASATKDINEKAAKLEEKINAAIPRLGNTKGEISKVMAEIGQLSAAERIPLYNELIRGGVFESEPPFWELDFGRNDVDLDTTKKALKSKESAK